MEDFVVAFNRHRTPRGGHHWMLMASNVQNISAGHEVGATPDGRHSGQPTSDACSPTFGRDQAGPTAAVRSVSKLPYHLAPGGNVVNMKISPEAVGTAVGRTALAALIRACFAMGGSELQFNTTDSELLRAAMVDPEPHEDLVVRVSGFSARFTRLGRDVQEDILARTEHRLTATG
jgi:formate C-acetyltransferase